MHEPLTTQLVAELLTDLIAAFPRGKNDTNVQQLATVYRNGLAGLSGDSVREAVRRCIQSEQYFPKVAKLREYASAYDRQRTATVRAEYGGDPDVCRVCGARAVSVPIQKPTGELDEKGHPVFHTVMSHSLHMTHDPRAHGIRASQESVA